MKTEQCGGEGHNDLLSITMEAETASCQQDSPCLADNNLISPDIWIQTSVYFYAFISKSENIFIHTSTQTHSYRYILSEQIVC